MADFIADDRREYGLNQLTKAALSGEPLGVFREWLHAAQAAGIVDFNAMSLATVDKKGKPSCRIVLLKEVREEGYCFFSNYNSKKGEHLSGNPWAAITFFWPALERQIRIEGKVERTSTDLSDHYFNSRPKGSQAGACASAQSQVVPNLDEIKRVALELKERPTIKRPAHWGGYLLKPDLVEFWQGGADRINLRYQYTKKEAGGWQVDCLAP